MQTNWRIGSLFGIPIYLDFSWFLILAFITIINASDLNAKGLSGDLPLWGWITGLTMALLLFVSVLLHELGHSLVARSQGIEVNSITLFLFGGIASISRESQTPKEAFQVAIAGPLVSIALFGLFFLSSQFFSESTLLYFLTFDLARLNLVIGLFNLIPGLPLDGGQILKALIWKLKGDRFAGGRWASASGKLLGYFAISLGIFFVLVAGELGAFWLTLIGWFILRNANAYDQFNLLQEALLEVVAADAMTRDFRVVNAHLSLRDFADEYILSDISKQTPYYSASEGRYRGLVAIQDLHSLERSEWDVKTLETITHPLTEITSVEEKTPLVEVIQTLEYHNEFCLTVLSPAGTVAGVIDRGDIVKAICVKQNLGISDSEIKQIKSEGTYPPELKLLAIAQAIQPLEH